MTKTITNVVRYALVSLFSFLFIGSAVAATTVTDAKWGNMGAAPSTPGVTTGKGLFGNGNYQSFTLNFTTTDNISATEIGSTGYGTVKVKQITLVGRADSAAAGLNKIRLTQGDTTIDGTVEIKTGNIVIYGNEYPGNSGHLWTQSKGYYVATFTSDVEFDVSKNITLQLLNASGAVANHGLRMIQPANSVLQNANYSPAIEIIGDYTYEPLVAPEVVALINVDNSLNGSTKINKPEEGWYNTNRSDSGPNNLADNDAITTAGITFTTGSNGNGKLWASAVPTGTFPASGTYTDINGEVHNTIAEEMKASLNVEGDFIFTENVYKTGLQNGQAQWRQATISGLNKNLSYVIYIGTGLRERTTEFKLESTGCASVEDIAYVMTGTGDVATKYNTLNVGAGVSNPGNGVLIVRMNGVMPLNDGSINFRLNNYAGINFIAISKLPPPVKATVTITGETNWSDIDDEWGEVKPAKGVPVEVTFAEGASLNIDEGIVCKSIKFFGAVAVSAEDGYTFPAINAGDATSLTVNGGTIEFSRIPSSNITIAENATLKLDVSAATTINGIAGAGKFLKTGTAELTLNNGATYALDGTTLEIAQGNVKMNAGNNGDPQAQNATFVIGANGSLNQNGWFNVYGTITFDLAADKSVFNSTIRTYDGTRTLVKKGAGTLTFGAGCNGSGFGTIAIEEGAVAFAGKEGFIKSDATFDFISAHNMTSAVIAGNFTFSDAYTFKFPPDWAAGETFQLCSGTLSGIPAGGKIEEYSFYCGGEQKIATFNILASNGSVFYSMGVKPIAPEADYAISTLNGETIADGQTVELTMKAGTTLTIDDIAKATTSVICNGILLIEGADGAEPTAAQLAALNFDGVTGKIVKKWLATMGVININLVSGKGAFHAGDTSDDGMLAGNTPKSSWINVAGETGSTTEITEWKTLTQESAEVTDMTFAWDANTVWNANATIPIRGGYLDDGKADGATLTLTGVPYAMYDVIVYFSTDQGGGLYQPMTVNGITYTGDAVNKTTILGDAAWGDNAVVTKVEEGVNALRVRELEGNVTIHTKQRASSTRGCLAAIQIVEVPAKEYRRSYTAEEGVNVTTSFLNEYIAEGDTYTGPFTLTLNGGKFIADEDFTCSALAINSATDLTIEKAAAYTISEAEAAKIAVNEFGGNKITFTNIAVIPATAPAAGKTYRWEGTQTLPAIPYVGSAFDGVIDIACNVAGSEGSVVCVTGSKSMTFSTGASYETQSFVLGNNGQVTQNFTQNGGALEFTKTGSGTTTSSAFVLGHWPSTVTYNLVGGTISVPNDYTVLGWDGTATVTIGGNTSTAKLTTKGIATGQGNNADALTIGSNGTLSIGAYGANLKGSTTVTLNGGTLEAYETCTFAAANANGIQVTADSTINIPENVTLTLNTTFTGDGVATITGAGTLNAGKLRDFSNLSIGDGIIVKIAESVADDGEINLNFAGTAPATITLVKVDGTSETLPVTEGKVSYTPSVAGEACWMDYEFEGNLNNIGTDTTALSRDGKDFGEDPAADFRNGSELYTGTHPYRSATYPTEWTCAIYGSIPEYGEAALITFGTQGGGLIGLIKGPSATDDTVYLVRTTGNIKYEVLAEMSVPNATTAQHLYAFVKTDKNIEIYLDGKHWKSYSSESSINFGGAFQIASVHGGVGATGIVRFDKALFDGDAENETLRKSVIGMMRLYNCKLGPKAMKILADEFQYVSPNGLFTRTLADGENGAWNEDDAWTKVLEGGTEPANVPDDKAMVRIATSEDAATLAINLDVAVTTEALEFSGNAALTIELAEGKTAGVANSGATTISAPLTIKYGALSISGGPTAIEEGGSVKFDYSVAPEEFFQVGYIPLTGDIAEQENGVVTAVLPEPVKSYLTYSFGYNSTDNSYGITVAYNRETTTLYLTANATLADDTLFALSEGGDAVMPRLFAEDVIVVPADVTMTIPTTALAIPLTTPIQGAGTIAVTGATLKDSAPLFTVDEDWTGMVEFTNLTMTGDSAGDTWFDLNRYGKENSEVTFTGVAGFMKTNTEFVPEVTLVNNNLAGLEINNGSSSAPIIFRKVKGEGNLIANETGNVAAQKLAIGDASELVGQIWMRNNKGITLGSTTSSAANNQILVADDATITFNSQTWNAGSISFAGALNVIGEVGSFINVGVEPTDLPTSVRIDGDNGIYTLKYSEGALTIAIADVEVAIPAIEGAYAEAYDKDGNAYEIADDKVVIPYGSYLDVYYFPEEGRIFSDGEEMKQFTFEEVTEAPEIDVTGITTEAIMVEVAIPELAGTTVEIWVTGSEVPVDPVGGKVNVPYNGFLSVTYTPEEGKLFTNGELMLQLMYFSVTEDPDIANDEMFTSAEIVDAGAKIGTTLYFTIADALNAAASGQLGNVTVVVLQDAQLESLTVSQYVTLDLNNKTVQVDPANITNNGTIVVYDEATTMALVDTHGTIEFGTTVMLSVGYMFPEGTIVTVKKVQGVPGATRSVITVPENSVLMNLVGAAAKKDIAVQFENPMNSTLLLAGAIERGSHDYDTILNVGGITTIGAPLIIGLDGEGMDYETYPNDKATLSTTYLQFDEDLLQPWVKDSIYACIQLIPEVGILKTATNLASVIGDRLVTIPGAEIKDDFDGTIHTYTAEWIYPEAEVEEVTPAPEDLDVAFKYTAKNDAPHYDAETASFVLTTTKAIPAGAIQLGGKFADMGWNIYELPEDIAEGGSFTVVEGITWSQVKAISPFTCGAKSIALTEDTEVTLTLKLGEEVIDTQTITLKAAGGGKIVPEEQGTVEVTGEGEDAVAAITPKEGVTKLDITMPAGFAGKYEIPSSITQITGVEINQLIIKSNGFDIAPACKIEGGNIVLDATKSVTVGEETIPVTPTLTASDDEVKPLVVSDEETAVGVKAIPGLTYTLVRSTALGGEETSVASDTATTARVTLTDTFEGGKPTSAFYVIKVTK